LKSFTSDRMLLYYFRDKADVMRGHRVHPACGERGQIGHRRVRGERGGEVDRVFIEAHCGKDVGQQAALLPREQAFAIASLGLGDKHHELRAPLSARGYAGEAAGGIEIGCFHPPMPECRKIARRRIAQQIAASWHRQGGAARG